jgi:hypothetical protein
MIKRIDIVGETRDKDNDAAHYITVYSEEDDSKHIEMSLVKDTILLPFLSKIGKKDANS